MEKALPNYINVLCTCYCTVPAALLKCEAFISKAFPIERHLTDLWCNNLTLGAKGKRGWKERRPLLLFNPLWGIRMYTVHVRIDTDRRTKA
jgi:hypothetical protein